MSSPAPPSPDHEPLVIARLAAQRGRLLEWLLQAAYPRWSTHGVDLARGTFAEALDARGDPLALPCRARVPPRQIYAFARASGLGWHGDSATIVRRGLDALIARYRRPDGLYRALVDPDGSVRDNAAVLYDQAFVLLGLAAAAERLDERASTERLALDLRQRLDTIWRVERGVYRSGETAAALREANPHMHLLEACLAWEAVGSDPDWAHWVDALADTAVGRFIEPTSGALQEAWTPDWLPTAEPLVEPGHQYEWAWLLMRCVRGDVGRRREAALRLIDLAERHGLAHGHAVNALHGDFSVRDGRARLWPQSERVKAARLALRLTGNLRYAEMAARACSSLIAYLDTPVPGTWFDERRPDGTLVAGPAPASSFYHLVGAIETLAAPAART